MEVRRTEEFTDWMRGLKDLHAKARILARIERLEEGNPGQAKSVGGGVVELKIDHGPGYRLYYTQQGRLLIILLCGGEKHSQQVDIVRAKWLAGRIKD